jgi:hypothetical protein
VILLLARLAAAGGERLVGDVVDRLAAVGGDADQDLAGLLRIGDPLRRELGELVMGEQHDVDHVGEDHAGGGVIGEHRVVGRPDRFIE